MRIVRGFEPYSSLFCDTIPCAIGGSRFSPILIVVFYCWPSMLAASKLASNVPPNHLQTAPVLTLTGITPEEFQNNLTALALQAEPAQLSQQYTTGLQRTGHPFLIAIEDRDFAVRVDSNSLAGFESPLQLLQLEPSER